MSTILKSPGSLADALFSRVRQRVLAILYGNPARSFYANEIIRLAGMGTGAVQRELAKLVAAGLLTVRRQGNQKHYQANPATPVYDELRGLVLKTSGLADVLHRALQPLASQIKAAFVYGSLAKREDSATSDIDLMIVSESLTHADLFAALEDATTILGRTVSPTVYTSGELQKRMTDGNSFMIRVLDQQKLWILGTEHELATG